MDRIQSDSGTQFTSNCFQEVLSVHGLRLALAAPSHQDMNEQVELTWKTLQINVHSSMVLTWFSDEYITFIIYFLFCQSNTW